MSALTPKRAAIAVVVSVVIITPIILWAAMRPNPSAGPGSPSPLIQRIDSFAASGEWNKVHSHVDYRAKGESLVPDLWAAGSQSEREELIELLKSLFEKSWTKAHDGAAFSQGMRWTELAVSPTEVMVEQVAVGTEPEQAMRYWCVLGEHGWRIKDRTIRMGNIHHARRGFVNAVRRKIAAQLGRKPTLGEFVSNAPSWLGRLRTRRIRVPDTLVPQKRDK